MHEFALAEAVVRATLETAEREGLSRVVTIALRIGELQHIRTDVFEFAMREVMPDSDSRLADVKVEIEVEPARFACRACGHLFGLSETGGAKDDDAREAIHFVPELAHAFLACPACRSPDFELTAGRGVGIAAIEGE